MRGWVSRGYSRGNGRGRLCVRRRTDVIVGAAGAEDVRPAAEFAAATASR
jgi:hypothetical protein